MTTTINGGTRGRGEPMHWSADIYALWQTMVLDVMTPEERAIPITHANYFTPRPAVDCYNRGSDTYGFTWTNAHRQVFQTLRYGDGYVRV